MDVKRIAEISRLKLSEEELRDFSKDVSDVLRAFEDLKRVNTEGVEPSFHVVGIEGEFREDVIEKPLTQSEALSNVKSIRRGYVKSPKLI